MAAELDFHKVFKRLVFGPLRNIGKHDLKVLLVVLQHRNSETGYAWPSLETIARLTTGSKSSAIAALKRLEADGFIKTIRKGGGRRKSTYRIVTLPEVPDKNESVPVDGTESEPESDPEKTVPDSPPNGTTLGVETVPDSPPNGTTLGGDSVPVAGTRIKIRTAIAESQSERSDERGDCDLPPSGFDFDWEAELTVDKNKPGSPFKELNELGPSEAAVENLYKYKELGRAGAQALLDLDRSQLKTGMYETYDREAFLSKCCWHPNAKLVSAAARIRRTPKSRPRRVIRDDAPSTRADAKAAVAKPKMKPFEDPETHMIDWSRMIPVDENEETPPPPPKRKA